jgi:hypothetical protein
MAAKHVTMIQSTPDGNLAICETCGDRAADFTGYGDADAWCTVHEYRSQYMMLNRGSRPSTRVLAEMFRDRSLSLTYTPEEREQWATLADELEQRLRIAKGGVMEGQMALFEDAQ